MTENTIQIKLFDDFTILKDGEPILTNLSGTRKTKLFVAYLLVNRDRAVSHKELFELLWSGEDYSNPGTALRTLLYRFRSMLEKEGANQLDNAVISKRGTYQWNKNLNVSIDVLEFESYAENGLNTDYADSVREDSLKNAIDLYRGILLPDFKSEPWMISKAAHYRDLYAMVVESYIELLKKDNRFLEIANISDQACKLIGSHELIELEGTVAKLSMASGKKPGNDLDMYYQKVYELSKKLIDDADRVQQDLEDDTVEQKAFVCDYDTFREIYRQQRRMHARSKSTLFLGLVDVRINSDDEDTESYEKLMNEVVDVCSWQLRCGDTLCRKQHDQLAILFPADSYEDAIGVLERLKRASRDRAGEDIVIVYRLRPLKNAKEC